MARSIDNGVYDRLGESWWDDASLLSLLHGSVTPGRLAYFRGVLRRAVRHWGGRAAGAGHRLRRGYLAEELAALGCRATGIDPSGGPGPVTISAEHRQARARVPAAMASGRGSTDLYLVTHNWVSGA